MEETGEQQPPAIDWENDPRNLGRLSANEVMLKVYGQEVVRLIEQSNGAANQASDFITTYVVG